MKPIPISAAERIAKEFGYDQVIVIARKVGDAHEPHGEHVTTYGVDKEHCSIAARIGDFLKYKVMGWIKEGGEEPDHVSGGMLNSMIDAYYQKPGNGAGGNLHIVLDDGNLRASDVQFCLDKALQTGDMDGVLIAKQLLLMPDDVRFSHFGVEVDDCDEGGGQ